MEAIQTFQPLSTPGHVLCCLCGTDIPPNPSNMCVNCIRSQVDITEGISKQLTILWCKTCGRYLQPPKHWLRAELESKELLTFCIKRIRGLSKVKLVDAGFIWTEPHSMRVKVKLTIQAEVFNGAILQQSFVVEYTVENNMCPDCNRQNANPNSWISCAQVRQHVFHKRTFLYLEQLILKHEAAAQAVKITDIHEGVDFFFQSRAHSLKLVDFLQNVAPVRFRTDKQLVSQDSHCNTYNFKYTFSVEIAPICKDDLICLPSKLSNSLGGLGPLVLCSKVTNQISLIDPITLRTTAMNADVYWRIPFIAFASTRNLTEYIVLDVDLVPGHQQGKWALAEAQLARKSDLGRNETVFFCKTHLGFILHPGDTVLGYDLTALQVVAEDYDRHINKGNIVPDVIIVRKSFEEKRRKRRAKGLPERMWKLRSLGIDVAEVAEASGRGRQTGGTDANQVERDRQRFLEELEEDADMRQRINLYKDTDAMTRNQAAASRPAGIDEDEDDDDDQDDDDQIEVPLNELLDDLEALGLEEEEEGQGKEADAMDEDA
mmetsp:Transcript_14422/g.25165  ORF Transcript_14422/g.25165 Transcript_14422/m.25165 type:complete len:545 (-) Transcript_14422:707-2341(-)|eukprot:CAMPEP_0119105824 /NCGR_PEP_ID=MMETSP1180-20130426/3681_1 /TAXON_ID=3052 ORGANISM="Chlamydomonas cf sp, Strain CCMP681" /NCGR_SAMPLE_ID=MMETSP1180 /ASSEMBLY_ACC=CAM_ASM_000741 /LENGTH=544 /DNA_ID=CAMNT_0007090979 /DNA_START=116 /DNA_END=1750 /DNA_ORIENTATION=-